MVYSDPTLIRSSKTSPISGYEKFQKGIFDVTTLKQTFYMNSPEKLSPEKTDISCTNGSSNSHNEQSHSLLPVDLLKTESKSPSNTSVENGSSPTTSLNPLQSLLPRFQFPGEDCNEFSPVSSFPDFGIPTGDDLDTISIVNSLKQRMKFEGLSQTKVARSLGKGQATVSQILNNPKPWAMLTERGKDTYRLLKLWLDQQMLSEGEDGKATSYDERLQKLATVTGLPVDQVQKWLSLHSADPISPHSGLGLPGIPGMEPYKPVDLEHHTSPLFRESPKNDMLLDLTRIRLKEEDILDLFKKPPECEATEICTQYAERVNLWIARGNFLSTEEISGEVRREIEKHSISQGMFSQKILRRKQATLSEALCHPKPWGRLSDRGKLIYCFMKLWLLLPDDRRLAPFKEESLQRFRQIPTQAIPVLEHEFKLYKGAPPKMVKEKLAEDLGLEYCTVTNFFSHCPNSNSIFKNDVPYSSCLPTMVKYPSPMDTLHSFSKPDYHTQLPPLSPMGRVGALNPLHPLTALHSQELQNGLLARSKSFLLESSSKGIDTVKLVGALRNRLRLLNISLHTFIDSVLLRKHTGTMVTLNELLVHPRPFITLPPQQKEVFLSISHWLERQPHEQLASISAFKPFDSLLFSSMEMTEIQNIISETHKFLKQYNLSQDRFATRVLSVRPEVLQDLFNSAPRTWSQLSHEQRNICHILKEWISDKEKFATLLESQESNKSPTKGASPRASGSRCSSAANPFVFPNTSIMANTTLPSIVSSALSGTTLSGTALSGALLASSLPTVRSPPTTIIQTSTSTSVPAFRVDPEVTSREGEGSSPRTRGSSPLVPARTRGSSPLVPATADSGVSPMQVSPSKASCFRDTDTPKSNISSEGDSVSFPAYGDTTRSIGSQKWPRQECCHEAFNIMLQHVRETSSKNIMLCNHLEQIYKHLQAPVKRDRTWTSPNTEADLENPLKRIRMSSPNS